MLRFFPSRARLAWDFYSKPQGPGGLFEGIFVNETYDIPGFGKFFASPSELAENMYGARSWPYDE